MRPESWDRCPGLSRRCVSSDSSGYQGSYRKPGCPLQSAQYHGECGRHFGALQDTRYAEKRFGLKEHLSMEVAVGHKHLGVSRILDTRCQKLLAIYCHY